MRPEAPVEMVMYRFSAAMLTGDQAESVTAKLERRVLFDPTEALALAEADAEERAAVV